MIYIDAQTNFCICKIVDKETGNDILVQSDWDYPRIASTFGWSVENVKSQLYENCKHHGTDGTINCPKCDLKASDFINDAGDYIRNNNGKEADDPGYF